MNKYFKHLVSGAFMFLPFLTWSQVTDTTQRIVTDSTVKVDTVRVVVDTLVKKDCYAQYHEAIRMRGAKTVTDGMQQVVIALKGADGCNCFMGQIEVLGGKIKPPLYVQAENGEYKAASIVSKKVEPAFAASMTPDELYSIKDGMSIVFRTADQEYGRLFFYKFVNKGPQSNKMAPTAEELLKE